MPQRNAEPRPIDLGTFDEATRRAVYDAVVAIHFNPTEEERRAADEDPEENYAVTYGPDEAELNVFHVYGRWFATWISLEEPDETPEHRRRELLRIQPDPERPFGLAFYEV